MEGNDKKIALLGLIATALTQFKWLSDGNPADQIPTPDQSYRAYNNDPLIHKFANVLMAGIDLIENHDNETIKKISECFDLDTGQKTVC